METRQRTVSLDDENDTPLRLGEHDVSDFDLVAERTNAELERIDHVIEICIRRNTDWLVALSVGTMKMVPVAGPLLGSVTKTALRTAIQRCIESVQRDVRNLPERTDRTDYQNALLSLFVVAQSTGVCMASAETAEDQEGPLRKAIAAEEERKKGF